MTIVCNTRDLCFSIEKINGFILYLTQRQPYICNEQYVKEPVDATSSFISKSLFIQAYLRPYIAFIFIFKAPFLTPNAIKN